jgi:hypothetical protein
VVQGHSGTAGQENDGKQGVHGKEKIYGPRQVGTNDGKTTFDLFCQDKYLLNHVDLKIKLRRSRNAFALVADAANYKIKIKEIALYVRKVQLSPAVRMGQVKALEKTSCKYPVRRVEVKVDTVPTGNKNYVQDSCQRDSSLPV